MNTFNIPNSLTILRIVLIPGFVIALEYGRYDIALYLFAAAAVSDALDGLFARLKEQKTQLGAILDPLADKFMLVTSFILYASYGWVPKWLTIIVIARDAVVVTGWAVVYLMTHRLILAPSYIGKAAIFIQFMTVCYVLLNINYGLLPGIKTFLIWLTALLVVASGLHYVYRELKIASEK